MCGKGERTFRSSEREKLKPAAQKRLGSGVLLSPSCANRRALRIPQGPGWSHLHSDDHPVRLALAREWPIMP